MKFIKSYIKAVLLILGALFISGCATTKDINVVYKTKTKYQEVPSEFTVQVLPPRPVPKDNYLAMPVYERESYMADYSVQVLKSLHTCNAQLSSISELTRKWKDEADDNQQKD